MSQNFTFRFAPSPNGALHLGHAYSALLNQALAERTKGQFLLRVEDIDVARCTPALETAMLEDLTWLGLRWETPLIRQSERFEFYKQAVAKLRDQGLLYPAFMTRGDIKNAIAHTPNWPRDPDGSPHYPGDERDWDLTKQLDTIKTGEAYAWRLDMKKALALYPDQTAAAWGDVVIARKDVPTSYHLSVALDDAAQEVTHVVRGQDLEAATSIHILLQKLLGLPQPRYFHHRLILDKSGVKLSKSDKVTGLSTLRNQGKSVDDIRRLIALNRRDIDALLTQMT